MMKMFRSDEELFQFPFPNEFHDEFISFKTAHVGTIGNDYSLSMNDYSLSMNDYSLSRC